MKNVQFTLAAGLIALAFTSAFAQQGTFKDTRDGKTYKTVKIGELTWFAENLNYDLKGSKCYNNKPENCKKYGRLYDGTIVGKACPKGWRVSSFEECDALVEFAGGYQAAGKKLKAASGWKDNGTDEFGFAGLPGGVSTGVDPATGELSKNLFFNYIEEAGAWWCPGDMDPIFNIGSSESVYPRADFRGAYSVRCVKD